MKEAQCVYCDRWTPEYLIVQLTRVRRLFPQGFEQVKEQVCRQCLYEEEKGALECI